MYYDKPARELIKDMIKDLGLRPGQVFTTADARAWFKKHYPQFAASNTGPELLNASTNVHCRLHYSANVSDDLLFKVGRGQFRLYEPRKDAAPIHGSPRPKSRAKKK